MRSWTASRRSPRGARRRTADRLTIALNSVRAELVEAPPCFSTSQKRTALRQAQGERILALDNRRPSRQYDAYSPVKRAFPMKTLPPLALIAALAVAACSAPATTQDAPADTAQLDASGEIGRASCRERVCQYV